MITKKMGRPSKVVEYDDGRTKRFVNDRLESEEEYLERLERTSDRLADFFAKEQVGASEISQIIELSMGKLSVCTNYTPISHSLPTF